MFIILKPVFVTTLFVFLNSIVTFAQQPATAKKECVSGNCINGKGKAVYPNGDSYEGDFVNTIPEGFGTFYFNNGNIYTGQMSKSQFQGKGKMSWKMGSVYEGDFVKDKREGQGTTTSADGSKFTGTYKGDWREGQGKEYDKSTNMVREGIWNGSTLVSGASVSSSSSNGNILSNAKEAAVDANIVAKKAQIATIMQDAQQKKTNKERLEPAKEILQLQKDLVQYLTDAVNGNDLSENAKSKYKPIIETEKKMVLQIEHLVKVTAEAAKYDL